MAEPAAQPDGQYPRLNASLLHSHKFVGKIISLVGCVESFDGTTVSLRCADGPIVPVNAQQAEFNHPTGTFVELVGFVNDDNSVTLFVTRVLSNDFDLDVYNQLITQVQHNPKFSHYFHPVAMKY